MRFSVQPSGFRNATANMALTYGLFAFILGFIPSYSKEVWNDASVSELVELVVRTLLPLVFMAFALWFYRVTVRSLSLYTDARGIHWTAPPGTQETAEIESIERFDTSTLSDEDRFGRLFLITRQGRRIAFECMIFLSKRTVLSGLKRFIPACSSKWPSIQGVAALPMLAVLAESRGTKFARSAKSILWLALLYYLFAFTWLTFDQSVLVNGSVRDSASVLFGMAALSFSIVLLYFAIIHLCVLAPMLFRGRCASTLLFGRRGLCILQNGNRVHIPWRKVRSVSLRTGLLRVVTSTGQIRVVSLGHLLARDQAQELLTRFDGHDVVAPEFLTYLRAHFAEPSGAFWVRACLLLAAYFWALEGATGLRAFTAIAAVLVFMGCALYLRSRLRIWDLKF